jgi:hypothetical protein
MGAGLAVSKILIISLPMKANPLKSWKQRFKRSWSGILNIAKRQGGRRIVATKIKETPVLKGEAARRFLEIIRENERKKVPKEDYERAKEAYRNLSFR